MALKEREQKTYAIIIADGSIRLKADDNDPKAVTRTIELKDGTTMTKRERVYHELSGFIRSVEFKDGDYGKSVNVGVEDGGEIITLSLGLGSNFGEDFLKKLPNVKFSEEVIMRPYSFEDDKKKLRKGITIIQGLDKLTNFFGDPETKTNLHGYPEVPKPYNEMDSDDWKIYFMQARKFLQAFTEANIIPTLDVEFDTTQAEPGVPAGMEEPTIEEEVGNTPFGPEETPAQ